MMAFKFRALGLTLVFLFIGLPNTLAAPKDGSKRATTEGCGAKLIPETEQLFQDYLKEATRLARMQNGEEAPVEAPPIEKLQDLTDALLVHQGGALKILKQDKIVAGVPEFSSVTIEGERVDWAEKVGGFYLVASSKPISQRSRKRFHYINIVSGDFKYNQSFHSQKKPSVSELSEAIIDDSGDTYAFAMGKHLFMLSRWNMSERSPFSKDIDHFAVSGGYAIQVEDLGGEVHSVKMSDREDSSHLPLIEVDYTASNYVEASHRKRKALFLAGLNGFLQTELGESSGSKIPEALADWSVDSEAIGIVQVPGNSNASLVVITPIKGSSWDTTVRRVTWKRDALASLVEDTHSHLRVDLDTLKISKSNKITTVLTFDGKETKDKDTESNQLILPGAHRLCAPWRKLRDHVTMELPTLLRGAKVLSAHSTGLEGYMLVETSKRRGRENVGQMLHFVPNAQLGSEKPRYFAVETEGSLVKTSRGIEGLPETQKDLVRLEFKSPGSTKRNFELWFNRRNEEAIALMGLQNIQKVKHKSLDYALVTGTRFGERGSKKNWAMVYSVRRAAFVNIGESDVSDKVLQHSSGNVNSLEVFTTTVTHSRKSRDEGSTDVQYDYLDIGSPNDLTFTGKLEDLEISVLDHGYLVLASDQKAGGFKGVEYHLPLVVAQHNQIFAFYGIYQKEKFKMKGLARDELYAIAAHAYALSTKDFPVDIDRTPKNEIWDLLLPGFREMLKNKKDANGENVANVFEGKLSSDDSVLVAFKPGNSRADVTFGITWVPGMLTSMSYEKESGFLHAEGGLPTMSDELPTEISWSTATNPKPELVLINKSKKPLYEDKDIEVVATEGSFQDDPTVYIKNKKDNAVPEAANLNFTYVKDGKDPVDEFIDEFFGGKAGSGDDVVIKNKQSIETVTRGEGEDKDLLYITTRAKSSTQTSATYVYSLSRKKVLFAIPNFHSFKDFGSFRIFIGKGDSIHPTIVCVVDSKTQRLQAFFNFGQTHLATDREDFIYRDPDNKDLIRFVTALGTDRVFDAKNNHFFGLLDKKAEEILEEIDGKVGIVLNRELFQDPPPPMYERDEELERLTTLIPIGAAMTNRAKAAAVLGPSGSGTTAAVLRHFSTYLEGRVKPAPKRKVAYLKIDSITLKAGTSYRGELADKFVKVRNAGRELKQMGYQLVVFIDNVNQIVDPHRKDDEGDIFQTIPRLVDEKAFELVVTSTPEGWQQLESTQPAFTSKIGGNKVTLSPLSAESSVKVIKQTLEDAYPTQGGSGFFTENALFKLAEKLTRMSNGRVLPASALDIVRRVMESPEGVKALKSRAKTPPVLDHLIETAMAEMLNIPKILLDRPNLVANLGNIKAGLENDVLNQDQAIREVMKALRSFGLENNRPDVPISSLMFLGPTGVGKTELVRAMIKYVFDGDENRLLMFSGEDYGAITKDFNPGKMKEILVAKLKQYPMSVVLFDEYEKMHPECWNIVLSALDGKVVDGKGNSVSTNLSFFVATSNVGVEKLKQAAKKLGFGEKVSDTEADSYLDLEFYQMEKILEEAAKDYFKPELLNRFDERIIFNAIGASVAEAIVRMYLEDKIGKRLRVNNGVEAIWDDSLIRELARRFVDPEFGGRRLVRNIENHYVREFIDDELLDGRLVDGGSFRFTAVENLSIEEEPSFDLKPEKAKK